MAEPTLADVFGANATQNETSITIQKADLQALGLTPAATNRAESILVAIVMRATSALTEVNRAQDLTNRHVTVNYAGQDLIDQSGNAFRRDAYSVLLYKSTQLATIDPDDY
ncbi:hypothetical protein IQ250_12530 [Pseudanabaenaceae cyanobacterium LEGE 13415]|nr:hypothetical protein [Pseudanabaenaceae cyanobacterium LEGE 13415]